MTKDHFWTGCFITAMYAFTGMVLYLGATQPYIELQEFEPLRKVLFFLLLPVLFKYAIQLICAPAYSLIQERRARRLVDSPIPSVSVLIPAWNEEVGIEKTIRSVIGTDYPHLQVVVINDGSTDGTHEVVTRFLNQHEASGGSAQITYLNLSNGGKAAAMNYGLMHATGEIMITVDADSVMDPNAIEKLVRCFDDPRVGGVAGNVIIANRSKPIEWIQQLEYLYGFFFKRADSLFGSVYIIGGAAAAYRRNVLDEMGGFDRTIITEDIEMSTRILSRGYKTHYAADAVVYTEGPSDWQGLCRQRLRWKYGRLLTFLKHRNLFFSTNHRPYLSFLLLPLAVYAEALLLLELSLFPLFLGYTVFSQDYAPLIVIMAAMTVVVVFQLLLEPKRQFHNNLLWLAPVAWLIFFVIDMVEFQALVRSINRISSGRELKWQRWTRIGVTSGIHSR
ncbi:glycosyltransferase [Tichowtungia aerotolerans]|uniref:Glycosyltransferase n=1 Tax=Tichowtungia aerotolerans TaxID=2697043 RepID=A0A6P1M8S6_9BACT|nr:glycosyltransferase family 2 protein [Tichowtungia aerotolerans]QHI68934.1 glycosyltransferase [Tichowtungia aerotolerans]